MNTYLMINRKNCRKSQTAKLLGALDNCVIAACVANLPLLIGTI
jgi:hypothetical protein